MLRFVTLKRLAWLSSVLLVLTAAAGAQERGEEIVGSISRVDGSTLTIQRQGRNDVRVQVTSSTQVSFSDSGDRRLFPHPNVNDLRAGMGVRFVYGTGTLDRIAVHYVPDGDAPATLKGVATRLKVRVLSVSPDRRELRADVAGRTETFLVEDSSSLAQLLNGDLVVITAEARGADRVVTAVESAALLGVVSRLDPRGASIFIETDGREVNYRVENRRLLQGVRMGDRVRFDVEERGSGVQVVTSLERR